MILAARAIQAEQAFLYVNETYQDCYDRFAQAIHEAEAASQAQKAEHPPEEDAK